MVIGVDTMTSILDFQDRDTCVIFGDGGGGVILEPTSDGNGIVDSILHMDGSGGDYLIVPGGGSRIPASIESVEKENISSNKMEKLCLNMLLRAWQTYLKKFFLETI